MRCALVGLSLAIAVGAQTFGDIPGCGRGCYTFGTGLEAVCDPIKFDCLCDNVPEINEIAWDCLLESCFEDDKIKEVQTAFKDFCKAYNDGEEGVVPTRDDIPECARQPLHDMIEDEGNCNAEDDDCLCDNWFDVVIGSYDRIMKTCGELELYQDTVTAVEGFCASI